MNESTTDRAIRAGAGVVLLILGATALSGVLGVAAMAAGVILVLTGAIGWCPIYAALRTGTRKGA